MAQMNNPKRRRIDYQDVSIGLGEGLSAFRKALGDGVPVGGGSTIVFRRDGHSLIIGRDPPPPPGPFKGIYFKHRTSPGYSPFSCPSSPRRGSTSIRPISSNNGDGTGEAYIAVSGREPERVESACEFAIGTNSDNFLELVPDYLGDIRRERGRPAISTPSTTSSSRWRPRPRWSTACMRTSRVFFSSFSRPSRRGA